MAIKLISSSVIVSWPCDVTLAGGVILQLSTNGVATQGPPEGRYAYSSCLQNETQAIQLLDLKHIKCYNVTKQ